MTVDPNQLSTISLLTMLAIAIYFDIRSERIPNWLVVLGIASALGFYALISGVAGLLTSFGGLLVAMAILLPFYIGGVMGAGDVKLMGAVGAFTGAHVALLAVGLALGTGVLEAIALLVLRGNCRQTWARYCQIGKTFFASGRFIYIPPAPGDAAGDTFPFAVAVGIGTVAALIVTASMEPLL